MSQHLDTLAVHAGRDDFAEIGVHATPLDLSSTYPLHGLEAAVGSLDALAAGAACAESPVYARLHNPTVARFEAGLAHLEGTDEAVAFASGMAALTACLLSLPPERRHVVATRPLYGGSHHLLDSGLLGTEVTWAEPGAIDTARTPHTGLVVVETPANPTLALIDIEDVVRRAGPVPVLVDSTLATPVLQRPCEQGAALVLHSATKFLGGHGDVVAGAVATDAAWASRLRQVRILTGAVLHPLAGYFLHRGLQTLPVRVRTAQETARLLATRLASHPAVARVFYPGLPGCDPNGLVGRQMAGPGALIAFETGGGREAAALVMESLALITPAVSLGSTDTLIQHPAGLTHRLVDPGARAATGISDGLLRLSVGLEDVDDLWADLARALESAQVAPTGGLTGRPPSTPKPRRARRRPARSRPRAAR
jgi:methionine-gamma-lyase